MTNVKKFLPKQYGELVYKIIGWGTVSQPVIYSVAAGRRRNPQVEQALMDIAVDELNQKIKLWNSAMTTKTEQSTPV